MSVNLTNALQLMLPITDSIQTFSLIFIISRTRSEHLCTAIKVGPNVRFIVALVKSALRNLLPLPIIMFFSISEPIPLENTFIMKVIHTPISPHSANLAITYDGKLQSLPLMRMAISSPDSAKKANLKKPIIKGCSAVAPSNQALAAGIMSTAAKTAMMPKQ